MNQARNFITSCALASLLGGCATGAVANESGGADNLPTAGAGPFAKPGIDFDTPADEPYVVVDSNASLSGPSVLGREDGGFRLWFSRGPDDGGSEIYSAAIPSVIDLPDEAPALALPADAAWEEGFVADPSVIDLGDDNFVMFYRGGEANPAIGRADSSDGGRTWQKHPDNPLLAAGQEPAIGFADDSWLLLYTVDGDINIRSARSSDGVSFAEDSAPAIEPRPDLEEAFDADRVFAPGLTITQTRSGRTHYALWFNGQRGSGEDARFAIGYAASFDGQNWERFFEAEPILDGVPPNEFAPSAIARSPQAFLFFSEERQNRQRIGVAVHP